MTLDSRARNTANNLLTKFGKSITLTRITEGNYDPTTGEMAAATSSTSNHYAIISEYDGNALINGVIQSGDKKVSIASLNIDIPQTGDKATIDALDYSIISVKSIWSGELAAVYELQVRK